MDEKQEAREIREIEAKIGNDLREVEQLEERLEQLTGDHQEHHHHHNHQPHEVEVTVDHKAHRVKSGVYVVAEFKKLVGVPPSKVLDEFIHGELKPLEDNSKIDIKGCEVFISHVRTGGSSH